MHRAKTWWRRQQHHVHPAVNDLLVSVQTDEALFWRNFELIRHVLLQRLHAFLKLILEGVSHGGENGVLVRSKRLAGGAGAAPAAADQAHAQSSGTCGPPQNAWQ